MPCLDRNARARLLFRAECLDRRTHRKGQHGGCLKRSGLAVLRALLFHFANVVTARCDPGYEALAKTAGVCRSTAAAALNRLEAAGLLVRVRRQVGRVRYSNAYRFPLAEDISATPAAGPAAGVGAANPSVSPSSDFQTQTTTRKKLNSYRELSTGPDPVAHLSPTERAVLWRSWCANTTLEETREHLRRAREHFVRRRAERERQARLAQV